MGWKERLNDYADTSGESYTTELHDDACRMAEHIISLEAASAEKDAEIDRLRNDVIRSWKEWHRKIADAVGLDLVERSVTLDAVRGMAKENAELQAEMTRLRGTPVGCGPDGEPDALSLGDLLGMNDEIAALKAQLAKAGHRLCQFKDAADELRLGCFPEGHEPFVVWAPGQDGPTPVQPEKVKGFYEAFALKLSELGDFSRLHYAERERAEALDRIAELERENERLTTERDDARDRAVQRRLAGKQLSADLDRARGLLEKLAGEIESQLNISGLDFVPEIRAFLDAQPQQASAEQQGGEATACIQEGCERPSLEGGLCDQHIPF